MHRRSFLKSAFFALTSLSRPFFLGVAATTLAGFGQCAVAAVNGESWEGEAWLTLHRPTARGVEKVTARYWDGRAVDMAGYYQICRLLRDVHESPELQVVQMDLRLLNLLFVVQSWLRSQGYELPIQILSGYRSQRTNDRTENAAKRSFHIRGMAVDIRIEGVPTELLGQLVRWFGAGGVGFYLGDKFIHADVGNVRVFSGDLLKRRKRPAF